MTHNKSAQWPGCLRVVMALALVQSCTQGTTREFLEPNNGAATGALVRLSVVPRTAQLMLGDSIGFIAYGHFANGDSAVASVAWSARTGSISGAGWYRAASEGADTIRATSKVDPSRSESATLEVVNPLLEQAVVRLMPEAASVPSNGSIQFVARAILPDGSEVTPEFTWSSTGGTISASGLFTALGQPGTFQVSARIKGRAPSGGTSVSVLPPAVDALVLNPSSVVLGVGETLQFTVTASSTGGSTALPALTWSVTGGTMSPLGLYTAGQVPGVFLVIVRTIGGEQADTSVVTISPPAPTLTAVVLTPPTLLLAPGASAQLSTAGIWSDGSTAAQPVTYSATGGTISAGGLYSAGTAPGSYRVIATQQGGIKADTSIVTITAPAAILLQLVLSPGSVSLAPGVTQQFAVTGSWSTGSSVVPAATYSATGGTISAGGLYTAGATPGSYRVIALHQGGTKADTSAVTVSVPPPTLTQLVLNPGAATLAPGATQQFAVTGSWSTGSSVVPAATYSATGGTISAGGLYTAGTTPGSYRVIALHQGGTKADTSSIIIAPTPVAVIEVSPLSANIFIGQTLQLGVTLRAANGAVLTGRVVTWASANPLIATVSPSGMVSAVATGNAQVSASSEGKTQSIQVTVQAIGASTTIFPGDNIQAAVSSHPLGTTFYIKAGVHRMQQVVPKGDDKFVGEPGAILSGAKLLTSFSRSGAYWVASGQTQQGTVHGVCQADRPRCNYPEDLFFDDVPLLHVASLGAVGPGKWFFDYTSDKIFFADDPTGHKVEASVTPYAFGGAIRDVTISGLIIEKYASPGQHGAIEADATVRWIVRDNELRWNHGIGIMAGPGMIVSGNRLHHQGQLGIAGGGENILIENNEIAYNNTAGFSWYWEAGGTKFAYTTGLIVRGNFSHDNHGPGLWTDINNINTLYENNRVEDNDGQGIFHEISYAAVIRNNIVSRNGWGAQNYATWPEGSGILINSSSDVEVVGNTLIGNANGISAIQSARGDGLYGPYLVKNLYVHDNTTTQTVGKTGIAQDAGDDAVFTQRNNRFQHNTYHLGSNSAPFRWLNGPRTSAQWLGYGHDATGTFVP